MIVLQKNDQAEANGEKRTTKKKRTAVGDRTDDVPAERVGGMPKPQVPPTSSGPATSSSFPLENLEENLGLKPVDVNDGYNFPASEGSDLQEIGQMIGETSQQQVSV